MCTWVCACVCCVNVCAVWVVVCVHVCTSVCVCVWTETQSQGEQTMVGLWAISITHTNTHPSALEFFQILSILPQTVNPITSFSSSQVPFVWRRTRLQSIQLNWTPLFHCQKNDARVTIGHNSRTEHSYRYILMSFFPLRKTGRPSCTFKRVYVGVMRG